MLAINNNLIAFAAASVTLQHLRVLEMIQQHFNGWELWHITAFYLNFSHFEFCLRQSDGSSCGMTKNWFVFHFLCLCHRAIFSLCWLFQQWMHKNSQINSFGHCLYSIHQNPIARTVQNVQILRLQTILYRLIGAFLAVKASDFRK